MSKIAGALSPNSAPERTKSGEDSSKNPTEEEKSVEELLEEAEKLVRENVGLSKSASRSDTLVPDDLNPTRDASRARRLEEDIFHQIEQEVHRESEKNRKSPKNEKKPRETSPGYEILYENVNTLEPPKLSSLESQKKRFDDHKVEVSSSSDLDDPIDRHSKSEDPKDPKETDKDKENLQKEITDVDKDFFDDLLRRSKEKMEGGLSGSSSFGQEDFSHFLRILQGQDRTDHDSKITTNKSPLRIPKTDNIIFPEREITEILEKELAREKDAKIVETNTQEFCESDSSVASTERGSKQRERESSQTRSSSKLTERPPLSRNSSEDDSRRSNKSKTEDAKKVVNSKNELYTVGLTPRLELFADAIPKLIAEKSENDREEKKQQDEDPKIVKTPKEKPVVNETIETANKTSEKATKNSENLSELVKKDRQLGTSRSYDQLPAPAKKLRSSLDDVRPARSSDHRRPSYPVKSTIPSKATKNSQKFPATRPPSNIKLKPNATKLNIFPKPEVNRYPLGGGDSRRNLSKDDYEILHREEKRKNSLLKSQIESEASLYKQQIQSMRTSFETELFALKKQNIILKAKIDELTLNERRSEIPTKIPITSSTRVSLLEKELEKQEGMINAYETENKRLILELKRIQEEAKITEAKKNTKVDVNETQRLNKLNDVIKDLKEEKLKMNIEITDLRQKNNEGLLKIEDVMQQNSLLKEELNMFKDQLRSKNEFINDRLQSMTTAEMESRKKTEDLRIELSSKTEQLKCIKMEYEKLREAVLPLEKELLELRVKDENLTKKLQISKSHVEREKEMTMKLKDQVILDNKRILDLNRQVGEMERILKRKNPDSVSALILSANSDHQRINLEKVKLLEERIASLEGEIKAKELISQEKLTELQKRFAEMKEKYVVQVMELEEKLIEATMKEAKICNDAFTQTATKTVENKSVEAGSQKKDERERSSSLQIEKDDKKAVKIGLKSQNPKEDAHLIATIRGLKLELVNKEKSFAKINKEFQELQKTNKRLQKEREKLLNDRRNFKGGEGIERNGKTVGIQGVKGNEANDQNSNVYHNGHVSNGNGQLSGSVQRLYDPLQYSENGESAVVRKLTNENEILKEELGKINKDFMTLKNKRLYDLNLLQEEHEREIAALVKEYSVKFGDSKVVKLQVCASFLRSILTSKYKKQG